MKTLAFIFGGVAISIVLYFGLMGLARRVGHEAGTAATKAAVIDFRKAMEPTPEQRQALDDSNAALEKQLEKLKKEAGMSAETGVN